MSLRGLWLEHNEVVPFFRVDALQGMHHKRQFFLDRGQ